MEIKIEHGHTYVQTEINKEVNVPIDCIWRYIIHRQKKEERFSCDNTKDKCDLVQHPRDNVLRSREGENDIDVDPGDKVQRQLEINMYRQFG